MTALVRYQLELLLRSSRWLPPFLTYALLMVVGFNAGESLLGAYGFSTAVLLPVTAWYVRCTATGETAASRACLAAAVGPPRAHLAALLAALAVGLTLGVGGFLVVWALGGRTTVPPAPEAPLGAVLLAGLLGTVVCTLLGLAVGALCTRPVLLRPQYGIPLSLAAALLVLVVPGSPANAVVSSLITASHTGRVQQPVLALAGAAALAGLVARGASRFAGRRTE
ncbi:ABC transporter [Kitasatospora sp. McL0602]|uniref:ABC transporter n=1 Tax=Kitasatospora sp. McL0602 TaxID=3439530 RepID=UPI003F8CDB1D